MSYNAKTMCCGLDNISCDNVDTEKDIKLSILEGYNDRTDPYFGVYTITTPQEKDLEQKLKNIGYKHTFSFYNKTRKWRLKMWTMELNKTIIKQFMKDTK